MVDLDDINRRKFLGSTVSASLIGIAGCANMPGGSDNGTPDGSGESSDPDGSNDTTQQGMLATAVSDQPAAIGDFESLVLMVNEIEIYPAGSDGEGETEDSETPEEPETAESGDEESESYTVEGASQAVSEAQERLDGYDGDQNEDLEEAQSDLNEAKGILSDAREMESGEDRQDALEEVYDILSDVNETISEVEGSSDSTEASDDGSDQESSDDDSEGEASDDRIVIELDEPAEFDLVKLQGDAQAFINEEMLDVGEYSQIKLRVTDEVDAVLNDGSQAEVVTPGNAPLMFKQDFEIRADTRTEFTADFAPHKRGGNGYILRPVAAETTVSYTEIESSESDSDGSGDGTGGDTTTDGSTDDGGSNDTTTDDSSSA